MSWWAGPFIFIMIPSNIRHLFATPTTFIPYDNKFFVLNNVQFPLFSHLIWSFMLLVLSSIANSGHRITGYSPSRHTFKLFETFAASVNNSCSLQIIHFRPSDSDVIWSRVERQFHCSNNTPLKWSHFLFQKSFLLSKEKRLFQRRQRVLLLSKINLIIKVLKPNSLVEGFLHSFHSYEECSKKSSVLTPWLHQSSIV